MKEVKNKIPFPSYTKKQLKILDYLYQFRFLHTYQFQKLFTHKDPHRVKTWLKDLVQKEYIEVNYGRNVFPHKPAIYSLGKLGRKLLKNDNDYNTRVLDLVYRKKKLTEQFINHHLTIADLYLFFLESKGEGNDIEFFTKYDLIDYEYLHPLALDAYIAIKERKATTRYFLHLFDSFTPPFVYRKKIKDYFKYYDENTWQDNTNDSGFPEILFVCHNNKAKMHVIHFARALFEKEYEKPFSLYVTSKETILSEKHPVWEEVEVN